MHVSHSFSVSLLARTLKLATLAPMLLISPGALALSTIENGSSRTIDDTTTIDSWLVRDGSSLTANGATTDEIRAQAGSRLVLNDTKVTASGTSNGVELSNSAATITNKSRIVSDRTGLRLIATALGGSTARVSDSEIIGGQFGASLSAQSQLSLESGTTVTATNPDGIGVQSFGGKVLASESRIVGGLHGVSLFAAGNLPANNTLILDKTHVEGQSGSAIIVNGQTQTNVERVNIQVNNGSTLKGGNGTLLEVINGASANFNLDNSHLIGDVIVANGASADVLLDHSATLTGRLENVQNLAVNNDASWVMVGDGQVQNLTLNGGAVQFGNPGQYFKLSVDTLSGEGGTFHMHNDFTTGQVDTLTVTGNASGNHTIALDSRGTEPVGAGATPIVHIGSGDATFALKGGAVNLGAFSYDLIKQGNNDWVLDAASRVISPGTQSVLALFNAAPTVWYGELSTLRTRMGEVRMDHGKAGGWIRAYGNKYDVSESAGVAYKQTQQGLSFGADAPLPIGDGQWLMGVLAGYSKSDLDMSRGTTGEVDSYYLGAYTTWLDAQSGYYFDGVVKYNRFQNESDVQLSDGKKAKGDYNNNGVGASLEFGRHIKLADDYFVEPYAQLSGLIIDGANYDLDNGLSADGDRAHSLLGKVGATVGRNFKWAEGKTVQPYLRAAYVHEFANNSDVDVNNIGFKTDLSGSRGELGAGVALAVTDKVSMHMDLDYSNGDKIEQPWGVNVGARYSW
ncbi:autotransporter outer membrane beta-barrel domain-containing protein [Pseudomonas frederiksbergensis]|uniref:Autotransporter outer membrane beta-barrel domain-containing protein n=1 Tax=Pseudomonas frederiksbergensis TaxID=104087 RepID=A0A423HEN5_9PSED|nr:autotransporter outer membrane beta-barrel domain-containing protein [Pseudomonas frederiksbergensis]RON11636.1 autotransporter outer membrane beta-barrel domain-containing protein [Pseudomonas frederiksbergensis]